MKTLYSVYRDIDIQINSIFVGARYNDSCKNNALSLLENKFRDSFLLEEGDKDLFYKLSTCANILHIYYKEGVDEDMFISAYEHFVGNMNVDNIYSLVSKLGNYTEDSSIIVDFILKAEIIDRHYRELTKDYITKSLSKTNLSLVH